MNLFANMIGHSDKEIDVRLFLLKHVNDEDPLPPFTRNYHFSYIKRD